MDAKSTKRQNGSTRRVTLHRGCLGVGNHPPTSKDGKSLITHDSHSEQTKGRKQEQDSLRNAPQTLPASHQGHLGVHSDSGNSEPRAPTATSMQRQTNGERPTAQSLSLSQTPPNHPRPAPRPPRSPPGQQQRWTSITRSPAATSMRKQSK